MILSSMLNQEGQPIGKLQNIMNDSNGINFALAGEAAEQAEQLQDIFCQIWYCNFYDICSLGYSTSILL